MSKLDEVTYVLPATLIDRADLARLAREVEDIDNDLEAQKARAGDQAVTYRLPNLSRSLDDFAEANKLDLVDGQQRADLKKGLRLLKDHAPVMHVTFAVEADPQFLQQLVSWIRQEIHPLALVTAGIQPALAGGVYVRTPSHVYDLSLRTMLASKRDLIVQELGAL